MRSILLRGVQAVLALSAVVVLTGAKGEGCGFGETGGGSGGGGGGVVVPDPIECEPGTHLETYCDDSCNGGCKDVCVPDDPCGEGYYAQQVCGGGEPVPVDDPNAMDVEEPKDPPVEDCWIECVPIDPCGPGFHEEWICDPQPIEDGDGMDPSDPNAPPKDPPDACYSVCVYDEPACPPGTHPDLVCDGDPLECKETCTPDDPGIEPI